MSNLHPTSGPRRTPQPARREIDSVPIDPAPATLTSGNTLREAIAAMTRTGQPAIPVLHGDGRYLGMCTVRAIADMCLPVAGALMTTMPSAAFVNDGPGDARRRIEGRLDESVASFIDASAPALAADTAVSAVLVALFERHAVLPVVDRDRRLIGVVRWDAVLASIAPAPTGE